MTDTTLTHRISSEASQHFDSTMAARQIRNLNRSESGRWLPSNNGRGSTLLGDSAGLQSRRGSGDSRLRDQGRLPDKAADTRTWVHQEQQAAPAQTSIPQFPLAGSQLGRPAAAIPAAQVQPHRSPSPTDPAYRSGGRGDSGSGWSGVSDRGLDSATDAFFNSDVRRDDVTLHLDSTGNRVSSRQYHPADSSSDFRGNRVWKTDDVPVQDPPFTGFEDAPGSDEKLDVGAEARRNAIEWAVVLVAAVLLALVLRAFLFQAFFIPSESMVETLLKDDRVLVNKMSYKVGDISRGDVAVFTKTDGEVASAPGEPEHVIKRVMGFGGETIEIRDNKVYIDGQAFDEPYLDPDLVMRDFPPELIPEGHLFMLGDNRRESDDSRFGIGPVAEDRVVGRAFILFWPLNRVTPL